MIFAHSDSLVRASLDIHGLGESLPFELRLELNGEQHKLQCQEIYRSLPGRRITLRAVLDSTTVVVKLYLGISQKRYWLRELSGLNILASSTLKTPRLLHYASDAKSSLSYLVFEYISPIPSNMLPCPEQRVIALSGILAQMHNEGIVQHDLHLNNFLVGDTGIYLIDGDAIKRHSQVSKTMALHNMAVLLAQVNNAGLALTRLCLAEYQPLRESTLSIDALIFHRQVENLRLKRLDKLLEKTQRNCTAYYSTSDMTHFFVCARESYGTNLQIILADLDGWVERGERLKDGNTCTVSRVCVEGQFYVIKRYNIKSLRHKVSRFFRTTRARVSWLNSHTLDFYGIPTAQMHALYEERKGFMRGRAFLIMQNLDGALLSEKKQPLSSNIRKAAIMLFQKLFEAGLVHGDTKSNNFIVLNDAASPPPAQTILAMIDLDAMVRFRPGLKIAGNELFRKAFEKDLKRFLTNFDADPELATELMGNVLSARYSR